MAKEIEEKIFFYSKSAPHGSGTCPLTRMLLFRGINRMNRPSDAHGRQTRLRKTPAVVGSYFM